jgi:hypothetical protein
MYSLFSLSIPPINAAHMGVSFVEIENRYQSIRAEGGDVNTENAIDGSLYAVGQTEAQGHDFPVDGCGKPDFLEGSGSIWGREASR